MYDDKIVMLMPALCGCQGKPLCNPPDAFCEDHRDVYHAMRRAIINERERCAKVALEEAARLLADESWQVKMAGQACKQVGIRIKQGA